MTTLPLYLGQVIYRVNITHNLIENVKIRIIHMYSTKEDDGEDIVHFFGNGFYNVFAIYNGQKDKLELSSDIFLTKEEAEKYILSIEDQK